ncbi:T9SS type B sorting domain-containing protein [Flavobacterium sp. 5]|uniref:T9SS type B sorting domain-containing protein n=1 Tax=Flavobacterium sp. 5 TaxID=2035199 RepID=UPI000C2C45E6|nr:T9SS type B sorting domain-containing protein [Flavobacterium sp. 5]PKB18573.1 gliding motility-associated-like protein [Flavobacterium sp. 5]
MRNCTLSSLFAPKKRFLLLVVLCFLTSLFSNAQNLISNGGFEGTGGFNSNYSLITPTGNSTPGQYAITTNPKPVNTVNFINSTDHSGTGNMMIVDGQNNDIFYKYTNLPIQRGLNYTFTYWILNVNNVTNGANPAPKIDLTLSNQCPCTKTLIAGNSDVGAMPSGWNKVSYTINVPGTGTAYIHFELSTNSAGGGGNDFAIDDVSLYAPPAPLTISTSVTNPSCPTGNDGVIVAYPNGGVAPFTFTLSGTASATNSTGIFQNLATGPYTVSVTDSNSPATTVSTSAPLLAPLDITLTASPTGCLLSGATVTLTAANGGATYGWSASPGGAIADTSNSIVVNPTSTTIYTVTSTIIPPSVGNLIGNPGFENGTSGFYSDYGYSLTNTSGTQFAYGIVTNPSTWYNKFTTCIDHTTGSGKMLVADGATIANSVIWSQTVPVETSKSYNFSFWVQNIGDGSVATFQVLVNGVPITISPISATNVVIAGTPATTTCNWTKITGTWNSSVATLATIKIIDTNISGGGNDFAIDDLSFSTISTKSCSLSTTKTVTIGGTAPIIGFSYTTPVCKTGTNPVPTGDPGFVTGGTYSSTLGLSLNASTGEIDLVTSTVGTYTITYSVGANAATCQLAGSSGATITINPQPIAGTSGNTTVCESSVASIDLFSLITGEQSGGTWTRTTGIGGTFNSAAGTFIPAVGATTSTFTYTLIGTSPCINSSSVATVNINLQPIAGTSGNVTVCESSVASIDLFSLIIGEQSGGTWTRTTGTGGTFNSAAGTFIPAVGATTSTFTYTLTGTSPCINSSSVATVNINLQPIAGTSGNATVCESSVASIDLFSLITGEQSGGTWTRTTGIGGTFNSATGTFIPAVGATTSTFTYTLIGTSPCINSFSVATVNINLQPIAGTSGNATVCESSVASIDLFSLITGEQSGGTWTRTTGTGGTFNSAAGTFIPAVGATTSTFTYTLTGTSPCINSSSVATVNINLQPIAGTSGNTTVCESSVASIDLFSLITGEQSGGIWTRTTGIGGTFNSAAGTFIPAVGATTSTFTYTLIGTSPCINSSSVATVNINLQPIAGTSGNTTVCESSVASIDLFSLITGEQSGGTWTRTTGIGGTFNSAAGTFIPAVGATTSTFTYTLIGTSPCINSSSIATVNINLQPIAGTSGNATVCESSVASIDLFSLITGEQSGGTWTRTTGIGGTFNSAAGTFIPAVGATTSTFTYTLIGTSPCINSSSIATVNINLQPIAGTSGNATVCESSVASIDLFSLITGEQSGGTWTRTTGTGGTFNSAAGTFIPAVGATTSTFTYTLIGTSPCINSSSVATVNINLQPIAGTSGNTTICESSVASIDLFSLITGEQSGGTWTRTTGTGGTFNSAAGTFIPAVGATTSTFTYTLTGTSPCINSSSVATVNINLQPIAGTSGNTTICESSVASIDLFSLITGEQSGGTWTRTTGTGGTFNSAAGTFISAVGATTSTFTYTLTGTSPCINSSSVATVNINAVPILAINCGVSTPVSVTFNWNSISGATSYDYSYSVDGGLSVIGSVTTTTLTINSLTPGQNVAISLTSVGNNCITTANGNCVSSNCPLPIVNPISDITTVCANGTVIVPSFVSTPAGATFNWANNNTAIGIGANGIGDIPSFTGINASSIIQTATISVTAFDGICTGPASIFKISINPLPTATISGTTAICSGTGTNITFSGTPNASVTYKINSGLDQTIILDAAGSAILPTGVLIANTDYSLVKVTDGTTSCSQAQTGTATISINALPTSAISGTTSICSGAGTNITFSGTPNATVTYKINSGIDQTIVLDVAGSAILSTGVLTANTDYSLVKVLNSVTSCSQTQTGTATISINALPTAAISGTTSICSGAGTNITFSGTPSATVTYKINSGLDQTIVLDVAGSAILPTGVLTANTDYSLVKVLNSVTSCSQPQTGTATISMNALPTATISGTTAICSGTGTNVTFSGTPNATVTYKINSGLDQTIVLDAAGSAILPTGVLTANTDYSLVKVLNSVTSCSQTQTGTATISINALPTATISGTTAICSGTGTNITFSGTPNATVTYKVNSGLDQTIVLDVSGSAILATGILTANTDYSLVKVLNSVTSCSQTQTGIAMISINALPLATITGTTAICSGTGTNITFSGTPSATVTYKVNSGLDQTIVLDAAGSAILPTGTLTTNTDYSLVKVLNSVTSCSQTQTGTATISINALPTATISGTTAICSGAGTNITFSGTPNATVTYKVNSGLDQTIVLDAAGSAILPTGTLTTNTDYSLVKVLNSVTSCSQTQTGTATISINALPTATISGTTAICSGAGTNITFSGTPNATVTYKINSGLDQTIVLDVAGSAILPTGILAVITDYSLVKVTDGVTSCSQTQTGTATISINALPTATISGTTVICSGTGTNVTFSGTPNATVTYKVNSGLDQTIVLDASGSAILPTGVLTANTDYSLIKVLNSVTSCSQTQTGVVTISINALPTATILGTTSICYGTGTDITFLGTSNATVTYKINSGVDQTIVLDASGSATLPTGTLIAITDYSLVKVTDATTSCSQAQTGTATISINALPTATISGTTAICSGTGANITFSGTPNAMVSYKIDNGSNRTIVLDASGSVILPTGTLTANTDYSLVKVTDGTTSCSQTQTGIATISINALPTATILGTTSICSGTGTNVTFSGTANATVTYKINSGQDQTIVLDASGFAILPTGTLTANTDYSLVKVLNSVTSCSQAQTGTATISINALPTATISGTTAICSGTGTNITFSGTPNATVTYKVNSGLDQTIVLDASGSVILPTGTLTANTNYSLVKVLNSVTSCSQTQTGTATISINALPTATISGTTAICSGTGTNITFSGTPSATVTYKMNSGVDQTIVLDAAGSAILPTGTLTAITDYSLVKVTDATTSCSQAQTGTATISINALPTATISGTTAICSGAGTNITFSGTPNATVTYKINSGLDQTIVLDAAGSVILPTGVLTANTDYSLVKVLNSVTSCSQTQTGTATISINALPTATISGTISICSGTGTNVTFSGTPNATVTYKVNSGLDKTIVLDAAGSAILPTGTLTTSTDYSLVKVMNSVTSCSQTQTGTATITIIPLPTIVLTSAGITSNQTLCINTALDAITYSIGGSATGANVTGLPAGVTDSFVGGVVTISGASTVSGLFNYKVTTTGGCLPSVILEGTIKVKEPSTLTLSSSIPTTAQTICFNDSISPISYMIGGSANNAGVSGLPSGLTYSILAGTVTINGTPTVSGIFNYKVTTIGGCSPDASLDGTITVNSLPIVNFTGATDICSGDTTDIVLTSTLAGTTFSWNAVQNNVSGASTGNGNTISQVLTATGNNLGQVVYNVTPVIGNCNGLAKMITINVSPVPNVIPNTAKNTLCSGETTNIDLSSDIVGTTFSWTINAVGVIGASAGNGQKINQLLSNTGFVPGTVDYIITPLINGCAGTPVTVTIIVNPLPEVLGTPPGTICSGYNTNIILSPTIVGTTFDWTVVQTGVTGAIEGTGNIINQTLETTGTLQGKVTYTIIPSLNGCTGVPLDIIVNVNPAPKPTLEDGVICVEEATGLAYKTYVLDSGLSASKYNFQWYFNTLPIDGAISNTYEATQSGDYMVKAINNVTGCDGVSETAKVTSSFPGLAIKTLQTLAFSDNATVTVTVSGGNADFEYQLDNGSFQTSNVFDNLKSGKHTITVSDTNGCTNLTQDFFVIGYPKFFSPNGDTHNDKWNVVGLEDQQKSVIYIFDRYGKLIKQISPTGEGWDGLYNGQPLPATDYWFTVEFTEQSETKLFKAHFSLIR